MALGRLPFSQSDALVAARDTTVAIAQHGALANRDYGGAMTPPRGDRMASESHQRSLGCQSQPQNCSHSLTAAALVDVLRQILHVHTFRGLLRALDAHERKLDLAQADLAVELVRCEVREVERSC